MEGSLIAASRVDTAPPESFALSFSTAVDSKVKLGKSVVGSHHKSSVYLMLHLGSKMSTPASGRETLLPPMYRMVKAMTGRAIPRIKLLKVIYVQTFCMPRENYVKEQVPEGVVLVDQ